MELLALVLLLCGSSWWWLPLLFGGRDNRHGGCGCFTFVIGAIVGGLIILGYLSRGGMGW